MKKILLTTILLLALFTTFAQIELSAPISPDSQVRFGTLTSGTSYYIRHNAKPKGQADFYIISDVGAIQEDDDQQGLAHFLEHMAFNGTKNFDGKEIIDYLETIGVKFGTNLNASTSWDVTQYLIKDVPVVREGVVDSALLILHDWAHFITPTPEEIDKERGVIKEELRTRDNANWRSTFEMIKALGQGTKYAERNLIGYLDYLDSFEPEVLIRFYETWYRPEYQAFIIVGDIDVDKVEQKLIALMADIPPTEQGALQKETIVVPDNEEPIISIYTDPEMQYTTATIFNKRRAMSRELNGTMQREYFDISMRLLRQMQNERFLDISRLPNAPFLSAYVSDGNIGVIPTMESLTFSVRSDDGKLPKALEVLYTEIERAKRHGYTESEFERAKEDLMSQSKSTYTNSEDRYNNTFVREYISHFRTNRAIPSAETQWQIDSTILSSVTLLEVNKLTELITHDNNVITIETPQKEGVAIPSKGEVLSIIESISSSSEIEPYEDKLVREPLIPEDQILAGSKVIKTTQEPNSESIVWHLENGIEVVVKPTTHKADEVILSGRTDGGLSILSDEDYRTGKFLASIMRYSGVSKFSSAELGKQLSGKIADASLYTGGYTNGIKASSSVSDVETMLQLLYLNFTAPRFDETDFEVLRDNMRVNVKNSESNPDYIVYKRFYDVAYDNSPRKELNTLKTIDAIDFERLAPIHDQLFGNGRDFRFIIIGNVDLETLRPLVEKYIGSLPSPQNKPLKFINDKVLPVKGVVTDSFEQQMQQPKVAVHILYSGEMKYNLKNTVVASFLNRALDDLYLKNIREQRGGTYGVRTYMPLGYAPKDNYSLNISFDTNKEQSAELIPLIEEEIVRIATQGVEQAQIDKSREYMLKTFKNGMERNSTISAYISEYYSSGLNYFADYEDIVNSVTSEDIEKMARKILRDGNRIEVVMNPTAE